MNEDLIAKTMEYRTQLTHCASNTYTTKAKNGNIGACLATQHKCTCITYEIGSRGLAMNNRHGTIYSNYRVTQTLAKPKSFSAIDSEQVHCKQQRA